MEATIRKDDYNQVTLILDGYLDTSVTPQTEKEVDVDSLVKNGVIGGLGIHLIRHYMDTVTYERKDGQNVLTMTKKRELKNYKIKEL